MATTVKRSLFASLLNTGTTGTPVWSMIGDGVTTATINYNPETSSEVYIHQDSGATMIDSYKPTLPIEATAKAGDAVFDYVDALRQTRAVLADAQGEVVNVWLYETPAAGEYPAERQACNIQIDSFGGDGGAKAKINYTINFEGDPVIGTYNPTTGAFTANPNVALLTSLALGGLSLTPAFVSSVVIYTTTTAAATNTITAASTVAGATVVILNGATPVTSGAAATWVTGVNHVKVTVSVSGEDDGIYHIDVTKTA